MAFGVRWQPESGYLEATDHVAPWQPDRFNNPVPEFGHTRNLVASPHGRHAYLSTKEGLLVFERVGVGAADIESKNDTYVPLEMLSVSPGEVRFGTISANGGGCIGLEDATIDGTDYTIAHSKWQVRVSSDAEWADIKGTEMIGKICSYTPFTPSEYRMVTEIIIGGETGKYASNIMTQ